MKNLKKIMKLAAEYDAWRNLKMYPPKNVNFVNWVDVRKSAYETMVKHSYEMFPKLLTTLSDTHDCGKGDCKKCNNVQLMLLEAEKV